MNDAGAANPVYDLHTHSALSDGTESPDHIVRKAAAIGLAGIALTDHDTTAGWGEASRAAEDCGITFIPGMELSAQHEGNSVHVLAFLFDPNNDDLVTTIDDIRASRRLRARRMVDRIAVDYDITWDDVLAQAPGSPTIGRPHIADALVARGHVPNRHAAFEGILDHGSPYYERLWAPSLLRAVQLVRAAGGLPVLAHPAVRGSRTTLNETHVRMLADAGLFGVEVEHRENTPEGKERLRVWAEKYGLAMTGASDYHGAGKPNVLGENVTDRAVVDRMVAEASGTAPINW